MIGKDVKNSSNSTRGKDMYNSKEGEPMIVSLSDLYSKVEAISVSTSKLSFCFY